MTERRRIPTNLLLLALLSCAVAACAGILGVRRTPARPFEHRAHVVRGIACVKCHAQVARSDAHSPLDLPPPSTCTSCHQKPHDTSPCGNCHGREADRHAVADAKQHLLFSHAGHAAKVTKDCTRCHNTVLQGDGSLRPTMATCLGCHEHSQQWAARQCLPCHRDLEDEHVRPASHVVHGPSFLAQHGAVAAGSRELCATCHQDSACAACHGVNVPALPQTLHFDEPNRPDMHAQGFFARHAIEARIDPATCTSCHRDATYCEDCHRKRGLLAVSPAHGSPHPPNWVGTNPSENQHGIEARRNPVACASCHGGAGEMLCVGCHRVGGPGGNPHPPGFSSNKPIGELPCRLCHAQEPR